MIDVTALLATPLEHAWGATSAPATAPRGGGTSPHLARAHALAARMAPSVAGHGGDEALLRAATELATILGEDAAAIEAVLAETFNVRCAPPWPVAKLKREAGRAAMRQATPEARYSRRAAARREAPADTEALAFHAPGEESPFTARILVMTPEGNELWHYDPRVEAYRKCGLRSLHASLRLSGADSYIETRDGHKYITPQTLINEHANIVETVHVDFQTPAGAWLDIPSSVMRVGVPCPEIAPVYDAAADAWLRAMAGDVYPALAVFVASCAQRYLHRPAVALVLLGPHSIGKSVLAKALARMWGATHPVTLSAAIDKFNSTIARCPIVLDDECHALKAKLLSTEQFRDLVQSEARDIEPKGLEKRTLLGCQRFMITGNDASDIRFSDVTGPGAVEAMAARMLLVNVDHDRRAELEALLAAVHAEPGRVDMDRLASHLAWVQSETAVTGERFIGSALANASDAAAALVRGTVEAHADLFDRLRGVLEGTRKPDKAILVAAGGVWVRAKEMVDALSSGVHGGPEAWNAARVARALAPFRAARTYVHTSAGTVRAWELDALRLVEATGADAEAALATLGR
jgi:hypothetical protein